MLLPQLTLAFTVAFKKLASPQKAPPATVWQLPLPVVLLP